MCSSKISSGSLVVGHVIAAGSKPTSDLSATPRDQCGARLSGSGWILINSHTMVYDVCGSSALPLAWTSTKR